MHVNLVKKQSFNLGRFFFRTVRAHHLRPVSYATETVRKIYIKIFLKLTDYCIMSDFTQDIILNEISMTGFLLVLIYLI